ncbi:hypothetical protein O9992_09195 [Vibrio lentus]|nr:hypothetical protein [Vibrio lentus]
MNLAWSTMLVGRDSTRRWKNMEKERQRLKETWINPKSEDIDQLNQILKTPMSREGVVKIFFVVLK